MQRDIECYTDRWHWGQILAVFFERLEAEAGSLDGEAEAMAAEEYLVVNIDGTVLPLDRLLPGRERAGAGTILATQFGVVEDARWAAPETPTLEEYLDSLPSDVIVRRMGSGIQVTPGMPNPVAGLAYRLLDE
jgi:hypothetical protein